MMAKAKCLYGSECDECGKSLFVAKNGWINNFIRRNGFLLHCKTATAQEDPKRLIDKLILYIFHARRLSINFKYPPSSMVAMDEQQATFSLGLLRWYERHL